MRPFRRCSIASQTARCRCGSARRSWVARKSRCLARTVQVRLQAGVIGRAARAHRAPRVRAAGLVRGVRRHFRAADVGKHPGRGRASRNSSRRSRTRPQWHVGSVVETFTRAGARHTRTRHRGAWQAAASVLANVEWPGKPGVAGPAAALNAEEQQRFNEGRDIYHNLCVACHQPDGRGREKVAPSLLGSEFALGPPPVPVRVLMNGKEGAVGLMPPLGSVLTDQQIAAVLTYIRREWGQAGSPVNPGLVTQIRPLTTGRTRPWTDDELAKIASTK